jgi:hypothetical protein
LAVIYIEIQSDSCEAVGFCSVQLTPKSRDNSVAQWWATGWTIGVLGFDSRRMLGIILFTIASGTPPIQWVQGALSLGVKRPEREADHSPSSTAEVKK